MSNGDYQQLKQSIESMDNMLGKPTALDTDDNELPAATRSVTEDDVMLQHGKALRQVSTIRDTYITQACDLCEQLKDDLVSLSSLEGRRGFDSPQFQAAIDLLYQHRTKHEDIDEFKQNMFMCKYCAEKLRGGKEVARSVFNCLSVMPVPDCITQLNIFERVLIKFCMTCLTVIRLGQISNTGRPQNELIPDYQHLRAALPIYPWMSKLMLNLFQTSCLMLTV